MVTKSFLQSGGVALFALAGMLLGFKAQEALRRRAEARVARRVEEGVEAAIAQRLAAADAAAGAAAAAAGATAAAVSPRPESAAIR